VLAYTNVLKKEHGTAAENMSNFENDSCMAVAVGWTYGGVN
jgi:hypothetical protein